MSASLYVLAEFEQIQIETNPGPRISAFSIFSRCTSHIFEDRSRHASETEGRSLRTRKQENRERVMPSARQTLSLSNAARSGQSTGSERTLIIVIITAIGSVCFGAAAWAFSAVAPQQYMVREAYHTSSVVWEVLLFVAKS